MDAVDSLPALYRPWVRAALEGPIAPETRSDCGACPMVASEPPAISFHPKVRCCSFHPELPNFLVGAFFRNLSPAMLRGRSLLEARLLARKGVTPLGIARPPQKAAPAEEFGQRLDRRCPYYVDEGRFGCGIWAAREATCATWHCKHQRGRPGRVFWEALRKFLQVHDRALARWCLLELGVDAEQLAALEDVGFEVDPKRYEAIWGEHRFAEHRFFAACHERVAALSPAEVFAIAGPEGRMHALLLKRAEDALGVAPGDELLPATITLLKVQPESYVVQSYSPYDLLEMPKELIDVLALFDGRGTEDVVRDAEVRGISLDAETLQRLVDFGFLSAP